MTATVEPTKKQMAELGKTYEPVVYDGAGHGFMRPGKNPAYKEREAKAAWDAIDKFFARTLKGA